MQKLPSVELQIKQSDSWRQVKYLHTPPSLVHTEPLESTEHHRSKIHL